MFLTAQQKLAQYVTELNELGYRFTVHNTEKRAFGYINKRDIGIELIVSGRQVYLGVLVPKGYANKTALELELGKKGFVIDMRFEKTQHLRYLPAIPSKFIDEVQYLIETLQGLDMLDDLAVSWKRTANVQTRIKNIVKIIKLAHKTNDTTLLSREMVDSITPSVSVNKKTDTLNYGEHVVPIDFLFSNSCAMLDKSASDKDLIDYWTRNLKVVYITEAQARTMDVDLKLRTKMPEGWQDGDDPFARLMLAEVKIC